MLLIALSLILVVANVLGLKIVCGRVKIQIRSEQLPEGGMRQTRMELNESAIEIMPSTRRKSNGSAARGMHATCEKEIRWARNYQKRHADRIARQHKAFFAQYYLKNSARIRANSAAWYKANRERALALQAVSSKKWRSKNQTGAGFITTRAVLKIWPVGVRTPTTTLKRFLICKAVDALIVKSSWRTRNFMWTTFILCQRAVQTLVKTYRFYARSAIYGNTITTRLITPDHWECSFEAIGVKQ